jgi:hypothetical protein
MRINSLMFVRVYLDVYKQIVFPHLFVKCPVTVCHISSYAPCIWKLNVEVKYPIHILCFDWLMPPFFMCVANQKDKLEDQL